MPLSIDFRIDAETEMSFNSTPHNGFSFSYRQGNVSFSGRPTQIIPGQYPFYHGISFSLEKRIAASSREKQFMDNLSQGKFSKSDFKEFRIPDRHIDEIKIDHEGFFVVGSRIWTTWLPRDIEKFIHNSISSINEELDNALKTLRWLQDIPMLLPYEESRRIYWKSADNKYLDIPDVPSCRRMAPYGGNVAWTKEDEEKFILISENHQREPVGHELLVDANHLSTRSTRGALMMAASAIEVSVKSFIEKRVPDASWIVNKLPSPPIPKILRDYIPTLITDSGLRDRFSQSKHIHKVCSEIFEYRNRSTHLGEDIELDKLLGFLDIAGDIVYIIDLVEGNDWAADHITYTTRKALDISRNTTRRERGSTYISYGPSESSREST